MLIKTRPELPWSEVTPESVYVNRRTFMRAAIAAGAGAALTAPGTPLVTDASAQADNVWPIANAAKSPLSTNEKVNAFEDITGYNNFYEFGTDKGDPARYAGKLTVRPWTMKVDGQVAKPGPFPLGGPMTVLQLIAMAGGVAEYANKSEIVVIRNENGKQSTFPFNYDQVIKRKSLTQNIELKPGDTVIVP